VCWLAAWRTAWLKPTAWPTAASDLVALADEAGELDETASVDLEELADETASVDLEELADETASVDLEELADETGGVAGPSPSTLPPRCIEELSAVPRRMRSPSRRAASRTTLSRWSPSRRAGSGGQRRSESGAISGRGGGRVGRSRLGACAASCRSRWR